MLQDLDNTGMCENVLDLYRFFFLVLLSMFYPWSLWRREPLVQHGPAQMIYESVFVYLVGSKSFKQK
jgi:hypothetical protein